MLKNTILCLLFLLSSFSLFAVEYQKNQLLIKTDPGIYPESFKVIKELGNNLYLIELEEKINVKSAAEFLAGVKGVKFAEPNYILHKLGDIQAKVSDPRFDQLWALENTGQVINSKTGVEGIDISAVDAWKIEEGSEDIVIAVIDTGIDYNHLDLKENMWINQSEFQGAPGVDDDGNGFIDDIHGYNFVNNSGDPMDDNGHGTHCAGTIAAEHDNSLGVSGVMKHASVMALKFLDENGSGATDQAISAIDYAIKMKVDIMSNSWGGGAVSLALQDAINRAEKAGIIFVAAAGNSALNNDSSPHYPSSYEIDNIVAVGSHNFSDHLSSFSCYGKTSVDLVAPGTDILSTIPGNNYAMYSGTSMATPHVSGVIGLYLSKFGKTTDYKQVINELLASTTYSESYAYKVASGGRLNAYQFLNKIYPERPEGPKEEDWIDHPISPFESAHPYARNSSLRKEVSVPGAKFLRVVINEVITEEDYDFLVIKNEMGQELERVTGKKQNYFSVPVSGEKIIIEFESDTSVQDWGFFIDHIQYIL